MRHSLALDQQDVGEQQENESTPDVKTLLTPRQLGALSVPNRIAMSPMARARARVFLMDIEAKYYSQRASAGLIITGGIYISRMAVGGINVPGIYTDQFSSDDLGQNDFCR